MNNVYKFDNKPSILAARPPPLGKITAYVSFL